MTASGAISPILNRSPCGVLCLFPTGVWDVMGGKDLPALQTDFPDMHATRRLDLKQCREAAPRGEKLHLEHVDLFEIHNVSSSADGSSELTTLIPSQTSVSLHEQLT